MITFQERDKAYYQKKIIEIVLKQFQKRFPDYQDRAQLHHIFALRGFGAGQSLNDTEIVNLVRLWEKQK